jgi:hypothetical protein
VVELEANNTSATKINEINGSVNGEKKCKKERVIKYLYRCTGKIKDTNKYMIRENRKRIKNTKIKKCRNVYKHTKSGNISKKVKRKYVSVNTCDVELEGARKNNIKARGKVSICKRTNNQQHKIKVMRMVINGGEYIVKKGRENKRIKKNITIPFGKGPCTHVKSTDRTRGKCTVHIISGRDSVREGTRSIEKSLCDVCRIVYIDNRYHIKCVIKKCDVVIDLNKMSTEPMDIPEGGGGGGGKGDGEKGKKNSPSLYMNVYLVTANEIRCNKHTIWNISIIGMYKVAVRHDRYGE